MKRCDENCSATDHVCLVLQKNSAFWFDLNNGETTFHELERVTTESVRSGRYPASRYRDENAVKVHLVLNTTLDELGTVVSQPRCARPFRQIERRLRLYLYQSRSSENSVYSLPDTDSSTLAVELQHIVPDHWWNWLVQLQNEGVSFVSVATGTELLCDWIRRESASVLLSYTVGDESRHLVVVNGVPVMLRQIPMQAGSLWQGRQADQETPVLPSVPYSVPSCTAQPESESQYTFDESLHRHQVQSSLNQLRESNTATALPAQLWCIDRDEQDSSAAQLEDARLMAGLLAGAAPCVRKTKITGQGLLSTDIEPVRISALSDCEYDNVRQSVNHPNPAEKWSLLRCPWRSSEPLAVSVRQLIMIARVRKLSHMTLASAVFGFICLMVCAWIGVGDLLERRALRLEQAGNVARQVELNRQSESIYPFADQLAKTVITVEQFNQAEFFAPDLILTQVASAISAVKGVSLDELVWAALDASSTGLDTLNDVSRIPVRKSIGSEHRLQPETLRIEMTGSVSGADLAVQKQRLDTFIGQLQRNSQVTGIKVMQSPVDAARSSERAASHSSAYRIVLDMVQG